MKSGFTNSYGDTHILILPPISVVQVANGMITGLCLQKYPRALLKEINPDSLNKRHLRNTRQVGKDYTAILADIESGIRHLHSLGLVHNNINPGNIMIDNGRAIIIDFGSCRKLGESLEDVGRTYEWYDEKVKHSSFENDLDALEEIRVWLGYGEKSFQFVE
jgi:serine/threonine protein kinase